MKRLFWGAIFSSAGLALFVWGLLIPAYFRALDAHVIELAGEGTLTVPVAAANLLQTDRIGPAFLLLKVAHEHGLEGREDLNRAVGEFAERHPELLAWGGSAPLLDEVFPAEAGRNPEPEPIIRTLLPERAREWALSFLQSVGRPGIQQILQAREMTNTVYFPPVRSASGQPFEAAILLGALLYHGDHLSPELGKEIISLSQVAASGERVPELEMVYLDLMTLAKHFNWVQLTAFMREVKAAEDLRNLAHLVRIQPDQLPALFAIVHLSGLPAATADYLMNFPDTGMRDLQLALRHGAGAVREVLDRGRRVHYAEKRAGLLEYEPFYSAFAWGASVARVTPGLASAIKYLLILTGGFLFARGVYLIGTFQPQSEGWGVHGLATVRQWILAFCLVMALMLFGEPFLAEEPEKMEYPIRLQFPVIDSAVVDEISETIRPIMDTITIIILVAFFVIQAVAYLLGILKLAEIRRQAVPVETKLKLLDNEETFFDSGLYLGLGGTVLALVTLALEIIQPSLMAAYSSTLFGIISVAVLKICHLRPFRRKLILEGEASAA